jgi:4-hydroxy-2-oxoheptanedioate aldolase
MLMPNEPLARRFLESGCVFTAIGSDVGLLARGTEQLAARFKNATT